MSRILIAEDDVSVGRSLVDIVEDLDHQALLCLNGRQAFDALLADNQVDLLITDVRMPEMDGRRLVEAVRADEKYSELPIIIMSGFAGQIDIDDLLRNELTSFMKKPVDLCVLQERISACLGST